MSLVVKTFDTPFEENAIDPEIANRQAYRTRIQLAKKFGYNLSTICRYAGAPDFPDPVGYFYEHGKHRSNSPWLYSEVEVHTWIQSKIRSGHIHRSSKMRNNG